MAIEDIRWRSPVTFVLVALAATLGLGNFFNLPYLMATHSGGTILILYALAKVTIALPLFIAEVWMARHSRAVASVAFSSLSKKHGLSMVWIWFGRLFWFSAFGLLAYYVVVTTWGLIYAWQYSHVSSFELEQIWFQFQTMNRDVPTLLLTQTILMTVIGAIMLLGISRAMQSIAMVFVLVLIVLIVLMFGLMTLNANYMASLPQFLSVDFSNIDQSLIFMIWQHAFLSTGIGIGGVYAFSMFAPKTVSIVKSSIIVVGLDYVFGVIVALLIWYFVFNIPIEYSNGIEMFFQSTLIGAIGSKSAHLLLPLLFMVFVISTSLALMFSMLPVAIAIRSHFHLNYRVSVLVALLLVWLMSCVCMLSFSVFYNHLWHGMTIFESVAYGTTHVLVPICALGVSVFVGWRLPSGNLEEQMHFKYRFYYYLWRFLLKFGVTCFLFLTILANLPKQWQLTGQTQIELVVAMLLMLIYLQWVHPKLFSVRDTLNESKNFNRKSTIKFKSLIEIDSNRVKNQYRKKQFYKNARQLRYKQHKFKL
ncbi:MAG: hypothetical protein HRU38_15940 [Saccharospirillaceae bacterium]|nr:hypothetical protein [Pseudomonadales bacterium]NRB80133.1 hypothetical protein [Saccharospirillaceae bacterium]